MIRNKKKSPALCGDDKQPAMISNLAALIKKLKESNSEAFSGADKKPNTVILKNFSALIKNQKRNSAELSSVDKKLKESNSEAFSGADKKPKTVELNKFWRW